MYLHSLVGSLNSYQLPLIVDEQLSLVWQILKISVCLLECFLAFTALVRPSVTNVPD